MKTIAAGVLGVILVYTGTLSIAADPASEQARRRFAEEYPAASHQLQTFYANSRMKSRTSWVNSSSGVETSLVCEFAGNGESLRCVQDGNASKGQSESSVIVAKPELSFRLIKKAGASEFSIISMGPAPPRVYADLCGMIRSRIPTSSAAFCYIDMKISDFVAEKTFVVKEVQDRVEDGHEVIRVLWSCQLPQSQKQEGWFDFLPDSSWALLGFERSFEPQMDPKNKENFRVMAHVKMTYSKGKGPIPMIQSVEEWGSGPGGKGTVTTTEVTEFTPGPVPASEFSLEAFGIRTRPAPKSVPVIYYLLALSGLCGLGALIFRWLQHRTTRPAPVG